MMALKPEFTGYMGPPSLVPITGTSTVHARPHQIRDLPSWRYRWGSPSCPEADSPGVLARVRLQKRQLFGRRGIPLAASRVPNAANGKSAQISLGVAPPGDVRATGSLAGKVRARPSSSNASMRLLVSSSRHRVCRAPPAPVRDDRGARMPRSWNGSFEALCATDRDAPNAGLRHNRLKLPRSNQTAT